MCELSVEVQLRLLSSAARGENFFEKGIIGANGYGFAFRLPSQVASWLEAGASKSFSIPYQHDGLKEAIKYAGALKTMLPEIELGGDEILFDVWLFTLTPDKKRFQSLFYYGPSGTAIGLINEDSEEFPQEHRNFVNYSPESLIGEERNNFINALKDALRTVPQSYFVCKYQDDFGIYQLENSYYGPRISMVR